MTSLLPFTQDLIRAFGWTLLHSFWQAFFVFACLRIVLRLWPQASASIKYHLSFLSLAGITGWFVATLYAQLSALREAQEFRRMVTLHLSPEMMARAAQQAPAKTSGMQMMMPGMESYFPLLVGIYIVGVTVMTIKLCLDLSQLRHVKRQGVTPMGLAWEQHLRELGKRLGITKKVQLFISDHLQVPVMIGFLKPVILLPAAMMNNLSSEQLEAILLHELAHIKRNDYLLNIFQSIVETILFFNPFVWWISRNIRQEREHCCDDLVIAGTVQPMHYAKALVALEEYRITANPMAMAAAHDKHFLLHRIKRIMEMKTKNLNYSQRFLALLIIVTGLVSIAWLNPARKNDKKEKTRTSVTDTIPPKAPLAPLQPGITPEPPAPPAPSAIPSPATPPEAPLPPMPTPIPAIAPLPPMSPAPFAAPLPPLPATAPLPPMPPTPPNWVSYNGNYNYHYSNNGNFYTDTLAPGKKFVIVDDKGNKKEYSSIDEMPAADRKRMEESYFNMQQARQFRYHSQVSKDEIEKAMKNAKDMISKMDWSKMNAQIQESMKNVDWDVINKQMAESMKKIDWNKMNADISKQMKDIQWDKISQQLKDQMKAQDWDKISKDIKESLDKVDWKKLEIDVKKSMEDFKFDSSFRFNSNFNFDYDFDIDLDSSAPRAEQIRARHRAMVERDQARNREIHEKNMARVREMQDKNREVQERNMERVRKDQERNMERVRKDQEKNMERVRAQQEQNMARIRAQQDENNARIQQQQAENNERIMKQQQQHVERAKQMAQRDHERAEAVNKGYRTLLNGLEADKLIDRNSDYQVEKKGNDLYINGQKQSADVLKKYGQYLKNDNVSIRGNKNSLNIQSNDEN